jgi:hypothetical protein
VASAANGARSFADRKCVSDIEEDFNIFLRSGFLNMDGINHTL